MRFFGANLEKCYAQIVEETLPDYLKALLAKLDAATERRE
jgi:hypothetical protein